ncbi:hypothetical protein EYC59_06475 [Candidatus Saccharibacteria bacterium]|nr:MAG: hypothetical protein EYC59_06475 [Candidatus Saccharibacteria bacterium]
MTTNDRWQILNNINEWIRFADAKAGVVLAACGVLGGIVIARLPSDQSTFRFWGLAAVLVTLGLAIVCAAICLGPSLGKKIPPTSLMYFGHISRKYRENFSGFAQDFEGLGIGDKISEEITSQIWVNSMIATKKYRYVNVSILLFITSLLMAGLTLSISRL